MLYGLCLGRPNVQMIQRATLPSGFPLVRTQREFQKVTGGAGEEERAVRILSCQLPGTWVAWWV